MTPIGRKKRLPRDARPVTVSLGGAERVILNLIEVRRQGRNEAGDSPSEIIADALRHYWLSVEKMTINEISILLPPKPEPVQSNVTEFQKKQ